MSVYSRRAAARFAAVVFLCTLTALWTLHRDGHLFERASSSYGQVDFLIVLPSLVKLHQFAPAVCQLRRHHKVLAVVLQGTDNGAPIDAPVCAIPYQALPIYGTSGARLEAVQRLVSRMQRPPRVVLYSAGADGQMPSLEGLGSTVVKIPPKDLKHAEWMGGLSLMEWENWYEPQVEITVVTQDRPASLQRLLLSLQSAYYYGDKVRLRINMDRKADGPTRVLVDELQWSAGPLIANWRITQGGLMTAVTEAWFPAGNHTYGIVLEDDIQVSPHFYAWVKMSILRYRYGAAENRDPRLFGISLYNQQTQELRTNNRQIFDAPNVFRNQGVENPHTPYLSQVPCSWGAVYFPEHWREYHSFLDVRLRGHGPRNIIPDIPSNSWETSWKRYFNELVFLRGYLMLYPNYSERLSLSTNHVEVGAHVGADLGSQILQDMRDAMAVPLLQDEQPVVGSNGLPGWSALPVMDLRGYVTTHNQIVQTGEARRQEISKCPSISPTLFEAYELLCHRS